MMTWKLSLLLYRPKLFTTNTLQMLGGSHAILVPIKHRLLNQLASTAYPKKNQMKLKQHYPP